MDVGALFTLEPHGPDTFVGAGPRYPWGGLYGGQIVAQALRAAAATVDPELAVHSLRAYFIRRGDASELFGLPLMDLFDARSHAALRGALVAAAQGKWAGHALTVLALQSDARTLPLELTFERFEFEGEPAVRLRVATQKHDMETLAHQLEEAMRLDSRTGLLRRAAFIESAKARAAQPLKAGLRAMAYVAPDSFDNIEREYGPIVAEEALDALARRIHEQLQPGDLASRVAPQGIALLLERGNARDQEAWLTRLRERIAAEPLLAENTAIELTCSIGSAPLQSQGGPLQVTLETAIAAQRAAAAAGGDRCVHREPAGAKPAIDEADRGWATQIKAALMANRAASAPPVIA
jgi:diguanylate cyclase (GGDEF)-like protein